MSHSFSNILYHRHGLQEGYFSVLCLLWQLRVILYCLGKRTLTLVYCLLHLLFFQERQNEYSELSPSISEQSRKEEEEQEIRNRESRHKKLQQKMLVVFLAILAGVTASSAVSFLFVVFRGIVLDNYPIHRPYEIPSLILFLVALFYFYKNQLDKKNDVFYKGIVGSILIDAFDQIIMSYSTASFDTAHNVAHILKDAALFC